MAALAGEGLSNKELEPEPSVDPQLLAIAQNFYHTYYQTFDTNRSAVGPLYQPESKLTFEGQTYTGPQKIVLKFQSLSFQQVMHEVSTFDCHLVEGGLLLVVMGRLKTDDNPPMPFNETFYLKQIGDSLFVMNQIFRLSLHNS